MLFIFYLTKTIKKLPDHTEEQDNIHRILWSALVWEANKDVHKINVNPKYANDISFIMSYKTKIHQVEQRIPAILKTNVLEINKSKKEKYNINLKKRNDESWKKSKCLGSQLDTKTDIMKRK